MTPFYLPYAALILVLFMSPSLALGATLCSGPLKPSCVDMDFTYESESSTIRCEQDLNRFLDEARKYVECLHTLIDETREEISTAKEEFDEKAGSNDRPQTSAK